tara:strand:+ start:126 stop:272 length:147 start_codon:yes stop_codon:yes gene_type:complete
MPIEKQGFKRLWPWSVANTGFVWNVNFQQPDVNIQQQQCVALAAAEMN